MHIYSREHYSKKVKIDADNAIRTDNITNRGPKLNKCLAVTQEKFEAESDQVKDEVERAYQEAKAKFARDRERLKAGKMPKVNEEAKVKAIRELGPMLDRVFRYISHATGGWKFSVLMAGLDPTKGGTVVYEYVELYMLNCLCELDHGVQFNTFCDKFNVVQEAFLDFTNQALIFEASLPQDDDEDESDDDIDNNSEMDDIPTNAINGIDEAGSGSGTAVGEINDPAFHTDSLYRMSPDSESQLQGQCSALHNDFGSMEAGLDGVTQDQRSALPHQLDFQHHDLDFNQLGLNNDTLALMALNGAQFQAPLAPNFVNTTENHTTGRQNDIPQIQAPPLDSLTPNLTTANNLTSGPPFGLISDMPLILPPPSTPPQTPHATDVRLPAVPDEATGPAGPELDIAVLFPSNRRRRTKTARSSVVSEEMPPPEETRRRTKTARSSVVSEEMPPPEETRQRRARNVTFNRRELDNAIGTSSARPRVAPKSSAKQSRTHTKGGR
ncbi:hypothetical protein EV424DRAFT_1356486 [Suillus variegatus]|nr:hypothetical protein EV424DRAFT_1356486 [Suillus variegatus]